MQLRLFHVHIESKLACQSVERFEDYLDVSYCARPKKDVIDKSMDTFIQAPLYFGVLVLEHSIKVEHKEERAEGASLPDPRFW